MGYQTRVLCRQAEEQENGAEVLNLPCKEFHPSWDKISECVGRSHKSAVSIPWEAGATYKKIAPPALSPVSVLPLPHGKKLALG